MIGDRLKRARAAASLSMQALGTQVGVSANMIKKYEHNASMPSSGVLIKLAKALGVRSEYFFRPVQVQLKGVEYRKRSSTSASLLKLIEADVLDQAERWQELANLWPEFPVPDFTVPDGLPQHIASLNDIEAFAAAARSAWDLGQNPVPNMIDELEARGVLVIVTKVDEKAKFDGLQAEVAGKPVIVVSANWPGDRQRFTLAHELGHLLLQGRIADGVNEEAACNRFASAFLLPASAIKKALGEKRSRLEARELLFLKMEWGLSMQACLYRTRDLAIIDPALYKGMFIHFSARGWRKREPGSPCVMECTVLFQQLVYRALGEGLLGESKAAELLVMSLMKFHQARKLEPLDAAANQ